MIGVLWMDDSGSELAKKVRDAAKCYRNRFGVAATLCYANPADVGEITSVDKIRVEPRGNILRYHFLVGSDPHAAARLEEKAA